MQEIFEKPHDYSRGGANSGAHITNGTESAELQRIVAAWPRLSYLVRAGILAMVEAVDS